MIADLAAILGSSHRRLLYRYLAFTAVYSVTEGAAFGLLVPLLTALVRGDTSSAGWWLLPLTGTVVLGWIAHFDMGMRALMVSSVWRRTLYERLGEHLVRLPLGWYDTERTGKIPQLMGRDVGGVVRIVFLAQALIGAILTPLTIFCFLLFFDWRMALPVLVAVPVVLLVFSLSRRLTDSADAVHDAASAQAGARLVEFAGAQSILRATGRSRNGRQLLDDALQAQHTAARRQVLGALPSQYLGQLTIQLSFTVVLMVGVLLATHTAASPARIIALVILGVQFLRPFDVIAGSATALRACRAAATRIAAVLNTAPLPEPDQPQQLEPASIDLQDVHFGYGHTPVLNGLSLHIPAGTTTALVGASGAGKTTVTKVVARFFDADAGTVRVAGIDVRDLPTVQLMDTVSLVFQDVYLFDATIEDNIRFGNPAASSELVRQAARRAQVDSIVDRLPDGWATRVGEGGRLLSGGERQRVAIARALCKDAPIVLLDEATSALDAENEAAVNSALHELSSGRTLLIIAHRLSTIANADQIAVLQDGRIIERGRHAELLAAQGRYAEFWEQRQRTKGWRITNK